MQHEQVAANGPHFSVDVWHGKARYTAHLSWGPSGMPRGHVTKSKAAFVGRTVEVLWVGPLRAEHTDAFDDACQWMSDYLNALAGVR